MRRLHRASPIQCICVYLHHAYRTSTISLEDLCIQPGKAAWVLYVDATCINYDGNVFDATLIAMVAALKNGARQLQQSVH